MAYPRTKPGKILPGGFVGDIPTVTTDRLPLQDARQCWSLDDIPEVQLALSDYNRPTQPRMAAGLQQRKKKYFLPSRGGSSRWEDARQKPSPLLLRFYALSRSGAW
jgi:hypothetical protein